MSLTLSCEKVWNTIFALPMAIIGLHSILLHNWWVCPL